MAAHTGDDDSALPAEQQAEAEAATRRLRRRSPSRARRALSAVLRIVAWTVTVVCCVLIVAFVLVPRVTGSTPYTVLTGSMRPSMPPGTLVVVRPIEFDQIRVGDIVTYQLASGQPDVVTHRVAAINVTDDGPRLTTKGDANAIADEKPVRAEQVRGVAWYWAPYLGYITSGISGSTKSWAARGIGILLLGYAAFVIISSILKRRRAAS